MKTLKTWLITIAVLLCSTTVSAHDFEVDGIYYNITSDTDMTVEVTNGGSPAVYAGIVVIPEYVTYDNKNYSVTSIGAYAFNGCTELTDVNIPNSVTNVDRLAFLGCENLPIENSIRYAGTWAIETTDKTLTRYTLRENTVGLVNTFEDCANLVRCSLPDGLRHIGDYTFLDCKTLKTIEIPIGVTTIGNNAFEGCYNLANISIPDVVTSIGIYAFGNCQSLTEITIPNSVTSIETCAFYGCIGLTDIIIPNSITKIGLNAFYYCN